MSMKVEDLMIGDWMCLADGNLPLEERYFKIEYLATSAGVSWVNQGTNALIGLGDGESLIPVFRDEIYPIPLTAEILEKNGFRDTSFEQHKQQHYIVDTSEHILHYHTNLNSFSVYKKKEVLCCFLQNNVQYVHELQHALKLCGIDKEIII